MDKYKTTDIATTIKKYSFQETLIDQEKETLKDWISEDTKNIEKLNEIFSCKNIEYIISLEEQNIGTKIYEKFNKKLSKAKPSKKKKNILWIISSSVAAIILLTLWINNNNTTPLTQKENIAKVVAEEEKIVLITPSGEVINLENSKEEQILKGISVDKNSNTIKVTKIESEEPVKKVLEHRIKVPLKKEINLLLSDGTAVWLNSGSEIIFPTSFEGKTREVTLIGEALFDVAKDTSKPFIVRTKILDTEVTGTQFLVSSYSDNQTCKVFLAEGSVKVSSNVTKNKTTLKPGKGVEFNIENLSYKEVDIDIKQVYAIKNGEFIFKNASLKEITDNLKYWYGVEFKFEVKKLENIKFYMESSKYDNLENILILLKATNEIDYQINNNVITIKEISL